MGLLNEQGEPLKELADEAMIKKVRRTSPLTSLESICVYRLAIILSYADLYLQMYKRLAMKFHPDKNRDDPVRSVDLFMLDFFEFVCDNPLTISILCPVGQGEIPEDLRVILDPY